MKYFVIIFFFILLNCKEEKKSFKFEDITRIVYISDKIVYDITGNYYILDKRFKEPGKHSLMMSKNDLFLVKKKIIDENIYKLDDSLRFVKSCESICLSEIIIQYKSGRKQHFRFDNSNYKNNFNNKSYRTITNLEESIMNIIINNVREPEPLHTYM